MVTVVKPKRVNRSCIACGMRLTPFEAKLCSSCADFAEYGELFAPMPPADICHGCGAEAAGIDQCPVCHSRT